MKARIKLLLLFFLLSHFGFSQSTWQIKPRVNYFHQSNYVGQSGSTTVFSDGSSTSVNRIKGIDKGKGLEIQASFSKISDASRSLDRSGYGLVVNIKLEELTNEVYSFPAQRKTTSYDVGLAAYFFIYEVQVGYGKLKSDNNIYFDYRGSTMTSSIEGGYFFLRQYINIPIYKGFSINGGLTWNYLNSNIEVNPDDNWRNLYFNYGVVYKLKLKNE